MRPPMSLRARQELRMALAPRYQNSTKREKQVILDEFVAATGYHRKYAIQQLKNFVLGPEGHKQRLRKPRPCTYDETVQVALVKVWEAANRICAKRLVPFLPEFIPILEKCGHLSLKEEVRARLLAISPSTVDRLLTPIRHEGKTGGLTTTRPGTLVKSQVPIRTFTEWDEARPGFMEADLVAHCGSFVRGQFLQTLVMTDIATGWTEFAALLFRDQETVLRAIRRLRPQLPFALLGLDTDNGTEFLNYSLLQDCLEEEITFTRARPYKKNDQGFVEEKNGSIVRKFIGYDRFEGVSPFQILTALYEPLRLYVNFFQPSLKLVEKTRQGSRVLRKYDQAQTPYQRVIAVEELPETTRQAFKKQFETLDPVGLLTTIHRLQEQLWAWAYTAPEHLVISAPEAALPQPSKRSAPPEGTEHLHAQPEAKPADRMYPRTNKPRADGDGQRWWRTRQDPFAEVWSELEGLLVAHPHSPARALLQHLQQKYPDQFQEGQLRTLQRRVQTWRGEHMDARLINENPFALPDSEETG